MLGLILGYDPHGGVLGLFGALALAVLFSFAISWAFTTMGLLLRSPNAVMNAGFTTIFPLTFLSNVFVDPETLPAGLKAFVDVNPITHLVDAARGLMEGDPDGGAMLVVLVSAIALTAIFMPITTRLYRRA